MPTERSTKAEVVEALRRACVEIGKLIGRRGVIRDRDVILAELLDLATRLPDTCREAHEAECRREHCDPMCYQTLEERDIAESRLQDIDIALGGSGEWSNLRDCGREALNAATALTQCATSDAELLAFALAQGVCWCPDEDGPGLVFDRAALESARARVAAPAVKFDHANGICNGAVATECNEAAATPQPAREEHYVALSLSSPTYGKDVCARCQTPWPCDNERAKIATGGK